jgi:hypothetical protein
MAEDVPDAVVADLARQLVSRSAPQELPLFRATSEAYFADPEKTLERRGERDEMLGFGVEAAAVLVTPVALEIAKQVAFFLATQFRDAAKKESGQAIGDLVRRLFRRDEEEAAREQEPPPLTRDQLDEVRRIAFERARQLDLSEDRAGLLADAVVGSLATG